MMKLFTLFIFLVFTYTAFAQHDWQRWQAVKTSYEIKTFKTRDYQIDNSNIESIVITNARNLYYFFISDLDGDNCSFYPSGSMFFVEAVKKTNIIKGTLMFADRFTRDTDFFKSLNQYPVRVAGKLFDPVYNYMLDKSRIKIFSIKNVNK